MRIAKVQELSVEKFAPYGTYADMLNPTGPKIGRTPIEFYRDMGVVTAPGGQIGLSITKVYRRPLIVNTAEYHDGCGEAMVPLDGDVLVHVAPATAHGDVPYDGFEIFRVPRGTLIVLRPGVWHHGPFCIDTESVNTLIVLPERVYATDCTVIDFAEEKHIEIQL